MGRMKDLLQLKKLLVGTVDTKWTPKWTPIRPRELGLIKIVSTVSTKKHISIRETSLLKQNRKQKNTKNMFPFSIEKMCGHRGHCGHRPVALRLSGVHNGVHNEKPVDTRSGHRREEMVIVGLHQRPSRTTFQTN